MEIVNNAPAMPGAGFTNTLTNVIETVLGSLTQTNESSPQDEASRASEQNGADTATPHIPARLEAIRLETHDTKSYFFQTTEPLRDHRAGAHINIAFDVDGLTVTRTYTLSSSPKQRGFAITVKRVKGGLASNWLFNHLETGAQIKVSQPQGNFVLPGQPAGKLLMLSAGSGITPLMSMLRYLTQTGNRSDILFLHYARSPKDIIFHDELNKLSAACANLSIQFAVERNANEDTTEETILRGRISRQQLAAAVPDILEREVYLCGPPPFMTATRSILDKLRCNPARLHVERFTADPEATTKSDFSTRLTFSSEGLSIQSSPSRTILEEAEAAGLFPPAACRMGICRTCRCKKQSGTTVNLATGEESSAEGAYILPCVTVAKTATTVEL